MVIIVIMKDRKKDVNEKEKQKLKKLMMVMTRNKIGTQRTN